MKPVDKKKIMTMLATTKYKKYHAELIKMNRRQKLGNLITITQSLS